MAAPSFSTSISSVARLDAPFYQVVNGELMPAPMSFGIINPATEQSFARSPRADEALLDHAVGSARNAFARWRRTEVEERRQVIEAMAARLLDEKDELATLLVLEQGKPLAAANAEVERAAAFMLQIGAIDIGPERIHEIPGQSSQVHYKPMGVVGAITPWNMPLVLAAPKIASAILAGNALVLKPSPFTPLATLRMAEHLYECAPPGVLNVIAGSDELGPWMSRHEGIDKINFTGSIETGRKVMMSAAGTLKRLTLELGGNDAAIVLDDANLDEAIPKLFWAAFGLSGQICMAVKRLFVPRSKLQTVTDRMTAMADQCKIGDGFEPGVEVGPIQNSAQLDRVLGLLAETERHPGARITTGGKRLDRPGYFVSPAIVTGIDAGARLVDEEQFGPVLPIMVYDHVDEVVERANATRFGLAGSVWTEDLDRGAAIAARLDAGFAWVNHHVGTTRDLPFGGVKQSGLGRQGHRIGVTSDMEVQVVQVRRGGEG
ncbi:aldehyde dehydrogenase family protein [Sphingopyxis indica]|uniref:aldehyde dehydrogenase family protein n=1 Tax=Sphingopyxis indica TaxID=436663 RepID=UPI002939214D|nr:aldehyde dehydrogenase family protein [Sphingopyxis indica]WOF42988.1 aldehyde dehydrogenase family protein [Sphingopyxis indica]